MPRAALLLIALIAAATPSPAAPQDIAELVGPTDEIPRNSYRSWALFLVCNPDWVTERRSGDLANLYWAFKRFGDAIGPRNLAVWFWKEQMRVTDPRLGDNVNVARAAAYCSSLSLIPSRGPFIVITTGHPGADSVPPAHGIFELGDLQPEQIGKLLLRLTDVLHRRVRDVALVHRRVARDALHDAVAVLALEDLVAQQHPGRARIGKQ